MENKYSNKYVIETGIGLQDVDKLKNSSYFINESERYIKGEITLSELEQIVSSYYKEKTKADERTEEADFIAVRIAQIISEDTFTFTVGQLLSIHKRLFDGVFSHAGKLRTYNFSKKEWVLDGASVMYGDYRELADTLEYDFAMEKQFNYSKLSMDEIINHLAVFVSNLWQIHAFEEGNTRTTAVFFIKYLRSLGFEVTNDVFAKNAWYFRNALVRANYKNLQKGIVEERAFLIKFLRNLLLKEKNPLNNKDIHINAIPQANKETKENRVLNAIKDNPKVKTNELALMLGVSVRTIKSLIATLKKNKVIERIGGKRFGYWKISEK